MKRRQQTPIFIFFYQDKQSKRRKQQFTETFWFWQSIYWKCWRCLWWWSNEQIISKVPDNDDVAAYLRTNLNDIEKLDVLKKIKNPQAGYNFPVVKRNERSFKFIHHWLVEFDWLIYSVAESGVYCKYCCFFAVGENTGSNLIKTPFNNYKKCRETFEKHEKTQYHHRSTVAAKILNVLVQKPEASIEIFMWILMNFSMNSVKGKEDLIFKLKLLKK